MAEPTPEIKVAAEEICIKCSLSVENYEATVAAAITRHLTPAGAEEAADNATSQLVDEILNRAGHEHAVGDRPPPELIAWARGEEIKKFAPPIILSAIQQVVAGKDEELARLRGDYPLDREFLGQLVRKVWVKWAEQQSPQAVKPHWLEPWEKLSEPMREVDREIGSKVAEVATAILQREIERREKD